MWPGRRVGASRCARRFAGPDVTGAPPSESRDARGRDLCDEIAVRRESDEARGPVLLEGQIPTGRGPRLPRDHRARPHRHAIALPGVCLAAEATNSRPGRHLREQHLVLQPGAVRQGCRHRRPAHRRAAGGRTRRGLEEARVRPGRNTVRGAGQTRRSARRDLGRGDPRLRPLPRRTRPAARDDRRKRRPGAATGRPVRRHRVVRRHEIRPAGPRHAVPDRAPDGRTGGAGRRGTARRGPGSGAPEHHRPAHSR